MDSSQSLSYKEASAYNGPTRLAALGKKEAHCKKKSIQIGGGKLTSLTQ
jgi:hypothetical protein